VAKACIENGAAIINDILLETRWCDVWSYANISSISWWCNTTNDAEYDPVWRYRQRNTVLFSEKVNKARSLGINDLIIDPGFGFAKQ
jgi:dihydropteroate synthase